MEPHRRPSGRRLLLPYELDLCESLGITPDEYWQFVFTAQEHVKQQGKEYANIPDIRNETVVITALINLAIGIALTALSALLAPKPKSPQSRNPRRLDIGGSEGRTRFTQSTNFDSVQQLANLGQIIPLTFADYFVRDKGKSTEVSFGGVRVNTELLHSQLLSGGNNQVLYAVMSLGMARLGAKPDYDGFAIGDLLVRDFARERNALYFANQINKVITVDGRTVKDNRITTGDRYSRSQLDVPDQHVDAFSVWWPRAGEWRPYFCGVRTPTTKTQFGLYKPMSNGHRYMLPLELVMVLDGRNGSNQQNKEDSRAKRRKIGRPYPRLSGIFRQDGIKIIYKVLGQQMDQNPDDLKPWGASDILSAQNEDRIVTDEALQPNQELMVGTGIIARVVSRQNEGIWDPLDEATFTYELTLESDRTIERVNQGKDLSSQDEDGGCGKPWVRSAIQQVSVGNITNSRPCHATEIGIKSEVWRQITNSINFNGWPKEKVLEDYEDEGDTITLGNISKYTKRYSFFALHVRDLRGQRQDEEQAFIDLSGDIPFAIRGTSPVSQYNTIHIEHPREAGDRSIQEYKLIPVPGFRFYKVWNNGGTVPVRLLEGTELYKADDNHFMSNNYRISFTGRNTSISAADATNPEWIIGNEFDLDRAERGPIAKLSHRQTIGSPPLPPDIPAPDIEVDRKYVATGDRKSCVQFGTSQDTRFIWLGEVLRGDIQTMPNGDKWLRASRNNGDTIWKYSKGDKMQDFVPKHYVEVEDSPRGQINVGTEGRRSYINCVYYNDKPGVQKYIYVWDNNPVWETDTKTQAFSPAVYDGKDSGADVYAKYRIALGPREENMLDPIQEAGFDYVDDPEKSDLYKKVGGTNGNPWTGAALNADGTYSFFYRGTFLGKNGGGGRNLYDDGNNSKAGDCNRWRAMDVEQNAVPFEEERIDRVRDCDPDNEIQFSISVPTGIIWEYHNGVPQTRIITARNGQTHSTPLVTVFIDGEQQVKLQPYEKWNDNNQLETINYPFDGLVYKPYKFAQEDNPPICGPSDKRSPVYRLGVWKVQEEVKEHRSITYQIVRNLFKAWQIEKHREVSEVPDKWEIVKTEIERTEPEIPIISEEDIRGPKLTEDAPEDSERNRSAKAEVKYYESVDAYSWKVIDEGEGYAAGERVFIGSIGEKTLTVKQIRTDSATEDFGYTEWDTITEDGNNYFPLNAVCDYFLNNTETSSHANGPEHSICFVNEIIKQPDGKEARYVDLALCGIKLTNSKEWSSFNNLSAWVAEGINVEHLITDGGRGERGATNLFPEIAYALLTDTRIGAGKLVGAAAVDREKMTNAARFCQANDFYWDGVISETQNLREFIFEQAAYILCDFTIIGGKFALEPSVPYGSDYKIQNKAVTIKALFTDGNMKDMKVTFLSPEERQLFKAVVLYRDETRNGFAETRTMTTYLTSGSDQDPVEQFDLTQFCTSENQARTFSRMALKLRELIDHGIVFETTPQSAMSLSPGDYIKVATKITHTDTFECGSVDPSGNVISLQDGESATFKVVYWKPGTTETLETTLTYSNNKTLQTALFGTIWAKVVNSTSTRVYKVETLSYADDGLVSVSGSYAPVTDEGKLQTVDWMFNNTDDFVEEVV